MSYRSSGYGKCRVLGPELEPPELEFDKNHQKIDRHRAATAKGAVKTGKEGESGMIDFHPPAAKSSLDII